MIPRDSFTQTCFEDPTPVNPFYPYHQFRDRRTLELLQHQGFADHPIRTVRVIPLPAPEPHCYWAYCEDGQPPRHIYPMPAGVTLALGYSAHYYPGQIIPVRIVPIENDEKGENGPSSL